MLQVIDGIPMFIVDFDTMPELPITGLTKAEAIYQSLLSRARGFIDPSYDPASSNTGLYAQALNEAIKNGIITEPGKYGIHVDRKTYNYTIHKIIE